MPQCQASSDERKHLFFSDSVSCGTAFKKALYTNHNLKKKKVVIIIIKLVTACEAVN